MKNYLKAIAIVVVLLAVGGGAYYALYGANHSNGTLDISVYDAPSPAVSAVYITFTNVSLHGNQTGWTNYSVGTQTVNILGLTATNASLLKGISLSAQKYTQIRLYIQSVNVTVNGANVSFNLASHYGFINKPFNVNPNSTTTISFAFNLNQDLNLNAKIFTPSVGSTVSTP